ncbi:SGNH/GDSL hydrolase family protein [Microbacterium oleivorans]|uniref:SGNH/GDSL hydrolase family protein n=1 Tax=Microbacterium oleivorans TaxID=273677 RepID=UPI001146851D|nr:SGNH/GDSL hydrolase family protein [Microbacterium oleivorans]
MNDVAPTAAAAPPKITFYNGSVSGTTLDYQQACLAQMFPDGLDLLFVSSSHNSMGGSEAAYDSAVRSFITAVRTLFPSFAIVLSSQNPRKVQSPFLQAHGPRKGDCVMIWIMVKSKWNGD